MKRLIITIATIIIAVSAFPIVVPLALYLMVWIINFPFSEGVVASTTSAEGVEICVAQYYKKNLAEPYQVSAYVKYPEGNWRWHYIEHEADRWRNTTIEIKGETAIIRERGRVEAEISVEQSTLRNPEGTYFLGTLSCEEANREWKLNR